MPPLRDDAIRLRDGRRLAFAEWGDPQGATVLFFHGTPGSRLYCADETRTASSRVRLVTVVRSQGIRVIRAPARATAGASARRRWVASLRRECLDRLLILGRHHLESVVHVYATHYNAHRPHRSLGQRPPLGKPPPIGEPAASSPQVRLDRLRRHDRLGGLLHEYELAA